MGVDSNIFDKYRVFPNGKKRDFTRQLLIELDFNQNYSKSKQN
jgi:hypothetical protein